MAITVFFMGLAIAQLAWGPIADRFGRKPVLYAGSAIYIVGAAGSALAPTFELLLLSRFIWGIGAAGARVVSTAIIRDRFRILGDVRTMTAQAKLSGLVLMVLPAVLTVVIYILSPTYFQSLLTDPIGPFFIVGAVVLQVIGVITMRRIIDIKV